MKYLKTFEKMHEDKGRVSDLPEFRITKTFSDLKAEIEKGNKENALKLLAGVEALYKKATGIA